MLMIEEERDYMKSFSDFVSTFLVTESATIAEIALVEARLDILKERITRAKKTLIKAPCGM